MKKTVSIFFLAIYLLSTNSGLSELVKLPVLVEHFQEHQLWDSQVSFLKFVHIHYFEDSNIYGDYERDMEMPFKNSCHSSIATAIFILPNPCYGTVPNLAYQKKTEKLIFCLSAYSSQYLSSIWQPPNRC